jgi:hypothetical protein
MTTGEGPVSIEPTLVYRRLWAVSYDLPGTEDTALYDEATSGLVLLNDVGAAVWELLDGVRSVADIVQFIVSVRGNPDEEGLIERDVASFLSEMLERRSIARVN